MSEQFDDNYVICPHCEAKYQCEAEDYSEDERTEKCDNCGKEYIHYDSFSVTHYTRKAE